MTESKPLDYESKTAVPPVARVWGLSRYVWLLIAGFCAFVEFAAHFAAGGRINGWGDVAFVLVFAIVGVIAFVNALRLFWRAGYPANAPDRAGGIVSVGRARLGAGPAGDRPYVIGVGRLAAFDEGCRCEVISHRREMKSQGCEIISHGTKLISHGTKLISHGTKLISRGTKLISRGTEIISRGTKLISRGTKLISHGSEIISSARMINLHRVFSTDNAAAASLRVIGGGWARRCKRGLEGFFDFSGDDG